MAWRLLQERIYRAMRRWSFIGTHQFYLESVEISHWLHRDPRQPAAPLRIHSSTHSDDVTALSFLKRSGYQPSLGQRHILLSASSDGLISTSDAGEDNEDEAVLHVGNWGCSVSQAGWLETPSGPKIWAASDMETFSTWSEEVCARFIRLKADFDISPSSTDCKILTFVIHRCTMRGGHGWQIIWSPVRVIAKLHLTSVSLLDRMSTCCWFIQEFKLRFISRGDVALLSNANLSVPDAPWYLHSLWTNGHVGIVRSLLWDDDVCILQDPVGDMAKNSDMFRTMFSSRGAKTITSMLGHAYCWKMGHRATRWTSIHPRGNEV